MYLVTRMWAIIDGARKERRKSSLGNGVVMKTVRVVFPGTVVACASISGAGISGAGISGAAGVVSVEAAASAAAVSATTIAAVTAAPGSLAETSEVGSSVL